MDWPLAGRAREMARFRDLLEDPSVRGVMLVGPAGVGKTRLAQEFLRLCAAHGWATRWAAGTRSAASIPFGALSPLLPTRLPENASRLELLQHARACLAASAADAGLALAVDDAHLLDKASATLVHQLAIDAAAFVIVTACASEAAPDPIRALRKDGVTGGMAVRPLPAEVVRQVIEVALGAAVDALTMGELSRLSQGNPLRLRELLLGGVEAGVLARRGGLWTHTGSLAGCDRIRQLIEVSLAQLSTTQREVLEVVAIGEPLGLAVAEQVGDAHAVADLERRGLLSVGEDSRRCTVGIADPLLAEVVAAATPRSRARHITWQLAAALDATGCRRRGDTLRLARWRLDGGGRTTPGLLINAAGQAHMDLDHGLAERLARAAVDEGGGLEASLLLGKALAAQGETAAAEQVLAPLETATVTDEQRTQAALARAGTLLLPAGSPESISVLKQARDRAHGERCRDQLDAMVALASAYLGDLPAAFAHGERLLTGSNRGRAAVLSAQVGHTYAKAMMGRLQGLDSEIGRGLQLACEVGDAFPLSEHLLLLTRALVLGAAGDLAAAEQLTEARYQQAIEGQSRDSQALWATSLACVLAMRGRTNEAARLAAEAALRLRERDAAGMLMLALSWQAYAAALAGHRSKTQLILADHEQCQPASIPVCAAVLAGRARAWLAALDGDPKAAADQTCQAGQTAVDQHHRLWGSLAFHDAVRIGHPDPAVEPLQQLAEQTDGALIPALADHAAALADGDAARLNELSHAFEAMGADLYAAEAAAQAAATYDQRGATKLAKGCRARTLLLAERCPGPQTPWRWITRPPHLTPRELQVASLAARGLTDRGVAERLDISIRTVGNHLSAIYRKLGAGGRQDLAKLLGIP